MVLSKKVIGDIGEYLASQYLDKHGFSIAIYGKANFNKLLPHLKLDHINISDDGLNCNFEGDIEGISGIDYYDFLDKYRLDLPFDKHFIVINFLVNEYIKRVYWLFLKENPLPHGEEKLLLAKKSTDVDLVNRYKKENIEVLNKFPGGKSHPGRYDFMCFQDGQYSAVEVKVNNAKLSYWQAARLGLIDKYGGKAFIINIRATPDQLVSLAKNKSVSTPEIVMTRYRHEIGVTLPSDVEFMQVINFDAPHEEFLRDTSISSQFSLKRRKPGLD